MQHYEHLEVYIRSQKLFPRIYKIVRTWNVIDQRELGSQIIRAANSIHANIAEGYSKSIADFKRHLTIAIGSCDEIRSHVNDARAIGLLEETVAKEIIDEYIIVGKQLTRLKQNWK